MRTSAGNYSNPSIVLGLCLTLAACGPASLINGNPSSVIVKRQGSVQDATDIAAKHCGQYGKGVRLIHTQGFIMSFDCV